MTNISPISLRRPQIPLKILTGYAVETRYPGDYEPVDEEDLKKAIEIAKEVLEWVKKEMDEGQRPPDPQKSLFK